MAMVVVGWLMRLAPYGVFALIAAAVARSGLGLLDQLLAFGAVVVVALLVHAVVVLVPILRLGAGRPLGEFFRSTSDALFLAFSTASSNATLPVSMAAATGSPRRPERHRELRLAGRGFAQQERIGRVQGGHRGLHRAPVRASAHGGRDDHDRHDGDGRRVRRRGSSRQLARHDAHRAERHRARPARRRRDGARRGHRPPARHVSLGGEHDEQPRRRGVGRAYRARRRDDRRGRRATASAIEPTAAPASE